MSTQRPWDDARTSARGSGPPPGPDTGPRAPTGGGPGRPGPGGPGARDAAGGSGRDLGWGEVDRQATSVAQRPPTRPKRPAGSDRVKVVLGAVGALLVLATGAFLVLFGPEGDDAADARDDGASAVPAVPDVVEDPTDDAPPPVDRLEIAPDPAPPTTGDPAPLTREPEDRTAFARAARDRTVTVYCFAGQSQGSGWPFRASSLGATAPGSGTLIVTNAHVVEGCERGQVMIELGDEQVIGDVVGYDLFETDRGGRDLALVRADINIEPFDVSTDVDIGHWVMAVGSPSGLDGTVTFGFIANDRDGVLIFDAAISPGNSGGPLVNARGEVIGTNTWLLGEFGSLSMALRVDVLCVRLLDCR